MNTKINELIAKATARTTHTGPFGLQQVTEQFNKEKFAELIVADCIGCIDIVGKVEWPGPPTYELAIEASKLKIKQYFGVK